MNLAKIKAQARLFALLAGVLPGACAFFPSGEGVSPLLGTWTTQDRDKVTFRTDSIVLAPDKGPQTVMNSAACNGAYRLAYGRMMAAPLQAAFPGQADLQRKLKSALTKPEYPVADVTCDHGGTTYLLLDDRQMLAVYRDAGVGGVEYYTRM